MLLVLLAFAFLLPGAAAAGNWITSGGDAPRSGLSDEVGPAEPRILWEGSLSGWFGTPVFIYEDRLVTMRFQSINYAPIVCHDLVTGDTLWTRDFPGTNSRSLPVGFNDGKVYAVNFQESRNDTLYALDARDGSILWRSVVTADMSITESVSYAADGDLLVSASDFRIARIEHETGDTVWTTRRVWPVTGSADICVHGNTVYAYSGDIGSLFLNAWDLADGQFKYRVPIEDTHPGGPMPQAAPMVGPDGVVYAHRVADNVTAIEDSGDSLQILWVHEISNPAPYYAPFAHFAVGPDGSVYVGSWGRIRRLDPTTGTELDSSPFIQDTSIVIFHCRISVDALGTVFVSSDGQAPLGGLYAFTPELELVWYDPVPRLNTSGPAIGPGGVLAVAGDGLTLRVYAGGSATDERSQATTRPSRMSAWPNPFTRQTGVNLQLPGQGQATIEICDAAGRVVRRLSGITTALWDGKDDAGQSVTPGVYLCRASTQDVEANLRLVKVE